jgi:hypothetical protein
MARNEDPLQEPKAEYAGPSGLGVVELETIMDLLDVGVSGKLLEAKTASIARAILRTNPYFKLSVLGKRLESLKIMLEEDQSLRARFGILAENLDRQLKHLENVCAPHEVWKAEALAEARKADG